MQTRFEREQIDQPVRVGGKMDNGTKRLMMKGTAEAKWRAMT